MGLELVVRDIRHASNTVSAFYLPPGLKAGAVQERLRTEFGVNLAGGQGELAGQILRLGHLGFVHQPELEEALAALRSVVSPVVVAVQGG
jgi:aspartate aminotransferase-like enzyme